LLGGLPAADQKAALRADLGRKRLFAPAPDNAVEIQGWLEAPWSAAALKIIAGCREGALPSGTHEDAFLPDQTKKRLGLVSQDARFARDAYLLSCLIHSGSRVLLGTSRFRSQGEPNRPSRLLFACGDEELPRRSRRLLRPSLPAKRQEKKASWTLELPVREKTVEAIRATGFKNYLQCPLRFYLQNVCGIRDFDPEAREISPRDFGTVMHKVLEEYGGNEATKDLDDSAEIARVFDRKLDEVAKRFYGDLFSPVVLVQLESMRARLRSLAPLQAQARADGWEFIATEKAVGKHDKKPAKIGPLTLTGTMDRVEVNRREGRVRVLDYKTFGSATTPAKTHLATKRDRSDVPTAACTYDGKSAFWKDLQLPLYRYLVPHIWEEHKDKEIEVGYVLLPADPDDTGIEMLPMDQDEFGSAVQCAEEIASLVSKGIFWPPSEKVDFDNFADWFRYCNPEEIVSEQTRKLLGGVA
jgi:ATP-dependent helicase/nuclease subunit B